MPKYDLSVLIPARNEMFLSITVENILSNIRGNTEILVLLDGQWANPGVPDDPRITIIKTGEALGQRAALNMLARVSQSKYLLKIDAHCIVEEGFDIKLMQDMRDNWTVVPAMYNLHMFDWVCKKCGYRKYQSPTPKECPKCNTKDSMYRDMIVERRESRRSEFYRFDKTLHFQYFGEFKYRPEGKPQLAPSMSLQGSCFMLTRDKWFELNICDEDHGSWGQQGVEVALKTWFSGGEVMVNKNTWYAHMFRTQGGDFGFPFPLSGSDVDKARKHSRNLFLDDKVKEKYGIK